MKKEKTPTIISLAILTLITSFLWVFFSLYRVFIKKSDIKVSEEILEPLSPKLDSTIISEIEKRIFIEQNQVPDNIFPEYETSETDKNNLPPETEENKIIENQQSDQNELKEEETDINENSDEFLKDI